MSEIGASQFQEVFNKKSIIFMGTPDFAVPSLRSLIDSKHHISAVFTQAPKPKGRGMKVTVSPVHQLALDHDIPVYHPKTLKSLEVEDLIDNIDADVIVVVAYGFIIPSKILRSKKYGCLNIHPSKLPRFRGAAPLQRTIIEGDKDTSVCIMQMDEGLDTGDIILQDNFDLSAHITLSELHDICASKGAELLMQALDDLENLPHFPQSNNNITYAHKLSKEEGLVDWNESAISIERKIRGMTPWPGVFFEYNSMHIKIIQASLADIDYGNCNPGIIIEKDGVIVCKEGALRILTLQKPGKGPISFEEFLRQNK